MVRLCGFWLGAVVLFAACCCVGILLVGWFVLLRFAVVLPVYDAEFDLVVWMFRVSLGLLRGLLLF